MCARYVSDLFVLQDTESFVVIRFIVCMIIVLKQSHPAQSVSRLAVWFVLLQRTVKKLLCMFVLVTGNLLACTTLKVSFIDTVAYANVSYMWFSISLVIYVCYETYTSLTCFVQFAGHIGSLPAATGVSKGESPEANSNI